MPRHQGRWPSSLSAPLYSDFSFGICHAEVESAASGMTQRRLGSVHQTVLRAFVRLFNVVALRQVCNQDGVSFSGVFASFTSGRAVRPRKSALRKLALPPARSIWVDAGSCPIKAEPVHQQQRSHKMIKNGETNGLRTRNLHARSHFVFFSFETKAQSLGRKTNAGCR